MSSLFKSGSFLRPISMNTLEKIFRRLESKDISTEEEKKLCAILDVVADKISDRMVTVIKTADAIKEKEKTEIDPSRGG